MTPPPAVGAGTLRRLGTIGEHGEDVLSVYLDLDPARFPTPASRETELDALLAQAQREGARAEAERVRRLVQEDPDVLRGDRGVAIFSCAASDTLEAIDLPEPVEPLAVLDRVPWLEPLAALVTSEDWGVVVLSRRRARLFRGGRRGLVEFAALVDDVHGRHQQGGRSQARYQRGIEQEVVQHVERAAERLLRALRRRAFERLVVVAAAELRPTVERSLHAELRERLAGVVERDLAHAPPQEILAAIASLIDDAERELVDEAA